MGFCHSGQITKTLQNKQVFSSSKKCDFEVVKSYNIIIIIFIQTNHTQTIIGMTTFPWNPSIHTQPA